MTTTNLPHLVEALNALGLIAVHDRVDTSELELPANVPMDQLDDLLCDAIFVDPLKREVRKDRFFVELGKRSGLRGASDMQLIQGQFSVGYVLQAAA
ncbi:MAG: hypothetical protein IPN44_09185 [Flavobacteriales bacterium]|nr:hypothetical protein [Flavobacteriales bacterium]